MRKPHVLQEDLNRIKSKYDDLARLHIQIKRELTDELMALREQNKLCKEEKNEVIRRLAQVLGTTQDFTEILPAVTLGVKALDELQKRRDNRPLVKPPFEGIGDRIRTILDALISKMVPKTTVAQDWKRAKKEMG